MKAVIDIKQSRPPEPPGDPYGSGMVLSVDPGTAEMGMALWELGSVGGSHAMVLARAATLRAKALDQDARRPYYRAAQMLLELDKWARGMGFQAPGASVVAIEPYHIRAAHARAQEGMPALIGAIMAWAITRGAQVVWAEYGSWSRAIKDAPEYAEIVESAGRTSEHARDAIGIGVALAKAWGWPAMHC